MNDFRKGMLMSGRNMSWCKPYEDADNEVSFVVCEGESNTLCVKGEFQEVERTSAEATKWFEQWPDTVEVGCRDCPAFDVCEAMDDWGLE